MKRVLAAAACAGTLALCPYGRLAAWTPQDLARADQHCAAAKEAARQAEEQERRGREFDLKAQGLTQEAAQLQSLILRLEDEKRREQTRLLALQARLRESSRSIQESVQEARAKYQSMLQSSRISGDHAGSVRVVNSYMDSVFGNLRGYASGLGRCADFPQGCVPPSLSCPMPPDATITDTRGFYPPALIRQLNENNRQAMSQYQRACQAAGQSASQAVQELRDSASKAATAQERLHQEQLKKERTDLALQQTRQQAATAWTAAKRASELAKTQAQAADGLMGVRQFCHTNLKDYSARIEQLRVEADKAAQKTEQLMKDSLTREKESSP